MNNTQANTLQLISAMISQEPISFVYTDKAGVTSIRYVRVLGIERGKNLDAIVRTYDLARNAPRSFSLSRIEQVVFGNAYALITLS